MTSRGGLASKRGTFGNIRNTGPIETEEVKVGQSTSEQTIIKKGDITSVGGTATLNNLVVSGTATFTGTSTDIQTENLVVKDPTIALGAIISSGSTGPDDTDHDRGLLFHYKDSSDNTNKMGFFGMDVSHAKYCLYTDVSINATSGELDTNGSDLGNLKLGEIEATQITATGITVNGNVTVSDGTYDFIIQSHDGSNGLTLGNTLVTSSGDDLNLVNGSVAGTISNNKAVIYGSGGEVHANTLEIEELGTANVATITFDGTNLTSNQDWKIAENKVFKIGNNTVLSGNTLGSDVVNVGPLNELTVDKLSLDSNIIQATSGYSLKIKSASDHHIKFYIGDTTPEPDEAMIIKSNGNVGIGTTDPSEKLKVNGNTAITGTLDVTGATNLNNNTPSTSKTTGALIVDGGVGIAQNLNVGANTTIDGNLTVNTADIHIFKA